MDLHGALSILIELYFGLKLTTLRPLLVKSKSRKKVQVIKNLDRNHRAKNGEDDGPDNGWYDHGAKIGNP